jgi:hypothetical protein
VNIPTPGDVLAAIFAPGPQAGPADVTAGPRDRVMCDRTGPEAEAGS